MKEIPRVQEMKEADLRGKTVVVVGASSGLGEAVSDALSIEGSKVIKLSRSNRDGLGITCDIRNPESITKAFNKIDDSDPDIDIIINCAGIALTKSLDNTTQDEVHDVLSTNLEGTILTTLEAYQRMIQRGQGHIVNVSSTTGLKFREQETIYAASKWGLRGFTESLRLEAAKYGVRVTGVYPGGMKTRFWDSEEGKDLSQYMEPELVAGQIVNILKSDRTIAPSEIVIERGIFGK